VDLLAADIGNAYLNADTKEIVYTTAGPEFGAELEGRQVIIIKTLYGLKSSGAAWRAHLANTLRDMGFTSFLADADVWYHAAKKPCGYQYYEYVLVYADGVLTLSHRSIEIMKQLETYYRLKDGYSKPTQYLGATVKEWAFPNGSTRPKWALSSEKYIKEAIRNIEMHLSQSNRVLKRANQPMPTSYYPELDITPHLLEEEIHFFQSQISILRWMVELGRLDIFINMALLSSFLMAPRQGHMEAVYCIYGYLKRIPDLPWSLMIVTLIGVIWTFPFTIGLNFTVTQLNTFQLMHQYHVVKKCRLKSSFANRHIDLFK
jgi:hypothetical protein